MRITSLALPLLAAVVVGAGALALGHGRGSSPGASGAATSAVAGKAVHLTIANFAFAPATVTVRAGTRVTVTNSDQAPHTATAQPSGFDSGTLQAGHSARFVLTKPGSYSYICLFHAFMKGTIKVVS